MNNPLNQDIDPNPSSLGAETSKSTSDSASNSDAPLHSDQTIKQGSVPVALPAEVEDHVQKAEEKSLSEHKAKVLSKPETEQISTQHSPSARYTQALMSGEFQPDEDQALAVHLLETLWQDLMQRYEDANSGLRGAVRLRLSLIHI